MRLYVMPTPTQDSPFESILVGGNMGSTFTNGSHVGWEKELSVEEAEAYIADLQRAVDIVKREQAR